MTIEMMKEYTVITGNRSLETHIKLVQEKINEGWEPSGSLNAVLNPNNGITYFYQAMVRV